MVVCVCASATVCFVRPAWVLGSEVINLMDILLQFFSIVNKYQSILKPLFQNYSYSLP